MLAESAAMQTNNSWGGFARRLSQSHIIIATMTAIVLLVFIWGVYGQILNHEFVSWDDDVHILSNPWLNPVSIDGIKRFWWEPYEGLYIPLSYTFFGAELAISDWWLGRTSTGLPRPEVFHWGRLFLHYSCVLTVFLLLIRIGRLSFDQTPRPAPTGQDWSAALRDCLSAGCGALIFALHPLQAESVAWISETRGLLSSLFSLLAISFYFQFLSASHLAHGNAESVSTSQGACSNGLNRFDVSYVIAFAFFTLALLAKPSAASVPIMLFVVDVGVFRRSSLRVAKTLALWIIPVAILAIITRSQQTDLASSAVAPVWARPLIAGDALAFYISKVLYPIKLAFDYGRTPAKVMQSLSFYYAWLVPAGVAVILWRFHFNRIWWVAYGLFVAGLLPVLGLIPFGFQATSTVADRYLYIAMIGPALAIATWLRETSSQLPWVAFLVLIGALGKVTADQTAHWRNDIALYQHALEINPQSAIAYNNLGNRLLMRGAIKEAEEHFRKAIQVVPDYAAGHYNLGLALVQRGELQAATAHLKRSVQLDPSSAEAHYDLATVLKNCGMSDKASTHYHAALRLRSNYPEAHNNLACLSLDKGAIDTAIMHLNEALNLRPDFTDAHVNLASALLAKGKVLQATLHLETALQQDPTRTLAHFNLGVVRKGEGRLSEAQDHFESVIKQEPENVAALFHLGEILHAQQQFARAVTCFDKVLEIDSQMAQAYYERAASLYAQNQTQRAIDDLNDALDLVTGNSEPAKLIHRRLQQYQSSNPQPAKEIIP